MTSTGSQKAMSFQKQILITKLMLATICLMALPCSVWICVFCDTLFLHALQTTTFAFFLGLLLMTDIICSVTERNS